MVEELTWVSFRNIRASAVAENHVGGEWFLGHVVFLDFLMLYFDNNFFTRLDLRLGLDLLGLLAFVLGTTLVKGNGGFQGGKHVV